MKAMLKGQTKQTKREGKPEQYNARTWKKAESQESHREGGMKEKKASTKEAEKKKETSKVKRRLSEEKRRAMTNVDFGNQAAKEIERFGKRDSCDSFLPIWVFSFIPISC
jgi:hypothetical protein